MAALADQKRCAECEAMFAILPQDRSFYAKIGVVEPTRCPLCRLQRRLACRNERFLFHRKCDLSGKTIISSYPAGTPFPVYDNDEWWGDRWDALNFGRVFDFRRPFFEQFFELRDAVPRMARQQQRPMENSDYCNCASRNKNCYLVFSTNTCEDCYYGSWVNRSRDCVDNLNIDGCELCYDCVGCRECYHLFFSSDCFNCRDSAFLRDCIGCKNCIGGTNLVNREYVVFNEQKTREEYEEFLRENDLGSREKVARLQTEFAKLQDGMIARYIHGVRNENVTGDYLFNSRNAIFCFDCDSCEDVRYGFCLQQTKSSIDYSYWGVNGELLYECQACGFDVFNLRFCNLCWSGCSDLTYCDNSFASKRCFGSVSVRRAENCILNMALTVHEFDTVSARIIGHMRETGEWGEFFPVSRAPYSYNKSLVSEYFPLSREEVLRKGWQWLDENEPRSTPGAKPVTAMPGRIEDVTDAVLSEVYVCEESGKPFKIIPQELKFYRRNRLALPRLSPDERHKRRLGRRNPRKLWGRVCASCRVPLETSYAPERSEEILCERCYQKAVY